MNNTINNTFNNTITSEKLEKYFSITREALHKAKSALDTSRKAQAEDFFDMASRCRRRRLFSEHKERCSSCFRRA